MHFCLMCAKRFDGDLCPPTLCSDACKGIYELWKAHYADGGRKSCCAFYLANKDKLPHDKW